VADNLVKFPKTYKQPPVILEEVPFDQDYHEQLFEYDDDSYVIFVLPKNKEFTIERMVFMAERVKRTMFDYAECEYDDEDVATVDDPNNAS
jgi:hypothetical protein